MISLENVCWVSNSMGKRGLTCWRHACCTYTLCYKDIPTKSLQDRCIATSWFLPVAHFVAYSTAGRKAAHVLFTYACFLCKTSHLPWIQRQFMPRLRRNHPMTLASSSYASVASLLQLNAAPRNSVGGENSTCMIVFIKGRSLACSRHNLHE